MDVIFFRQLLKVDRSPKADIICQEIMLLLYNMLIVASNGNKNASTYEKHTIHMIQQKDGSKSDERFVRQMPIWYNDDQESRGCRLVLLNVLNYIFIDTCVSNVISRQKVKVLSFTA